MNLLKKIFLKTSIAVLTVIGGIVCLIIAFFLEAIELIFIIGDAIDNEELT